METLYCSICGCEINAFHNVLKGIVEFFFDNPDVLITDCPHCGDKLSRDTLLTSPPAKKEE